MKITFPLPQDGKMHRFCSSCKNEGAEQIHVSSQTKYRCSICGAINDRAIYFNKHKFWLDKDKELWHESCGVFVRNSESKYLFYKRTGYPYLLTIPSGHVDIGELPEKAALRELEEETGIRGKLRYIGTEDVPGDSCSAGADFHKWHAYVLDVTDNVKEISILDEGEAALWLTLEQAQQQGWVFVVDYMSKKYKVKL